MGDLYQFVRPIPVWDQLDSDIQTLKDCFNGPISAYAIVVWDRTGRFNGGYVAGDMDDLPAEAYDALNEIADDDEPEIEVSLEPSNSNSILESLIDKGIIRPDSDGKNT